MSFSSARNRKEIKKRKKPTSNPTSTRESFEKKKIPPGKEKFSPANSRLDSALNTAWMHKNSPGLVVRRGCMAGP